MPPRRSQSAVLSQSAKVSPRVRPRASVVVGSDARGGADDRSFEEIIAPL